MEESGSFNPYFKTKESQKLDFDPHFGQTRLFISLLKAILTDP
jgi:hypothetical protein